MSRNYMFTINNPSPEEYDALTVLRDIVRAGKKEFVFLVFQTEKGAEGTVHIQGYLELGRTQRMTGLKKFPAFFRARLDARRGTQSQAIAYCTKEDSRIEGPAGRFGEPTVQGRRTDLENFRRGIEAGETTLNLARAMFGTYVRNYRALGQYRLMVEQEQGLLRAQQGTDRGAPSVEIHWGPTGTGKSRHVYETFPGAYWVARADGVAYFDGVNNETSVIVCDDFYSWLRYDLILRMCDRYPLQLKVHGGYVTCPVLTHVIFTSNQDPRTWYNGYSKMGGWETSAFKRRVTRIVHYSAL